MEQFVLGIFQEHLSRFIIGFRKEQVNANLLNGKGQITNVALNCAFLNDLVSQVTPFIQFESIHISKLSFHVQSWTNLRKAPILIDMEHITAVLKEPLHYTPRERRRRLQQITQSQLKQLLRQGSTHKGPYNLFDRILDNLTVEIQSIDVRFQTWGKFKTERHGPWTPPVLQCKLQHLRMASVNPFGQEGPPEQVWRHNHHRKQDYFIYKRISLQYSVGLGESTTLVEGQAHVHLALQRRLRDGEYLSVQIDTVLPYFYVTLSHEVLPPLAHVVSGLMYCLAKDRGFEDPLKAASNQERVEVSVVETSQGSLIDIVDDISIPEDERSSSEEGDEEADEGNQEDGEGEDKGEAGPATPSRAGSKVNAPRVPAATPTRSDERPVLLLPNGIVIHERLSFSVSIQRSTVRGVYAKDGYVECTANGLIAEGIWPKVTLEKGGYAQVSVAFVSVQERHKDRLRTILKGGVEYHETGLGRGKPLNEVALDETFPLFEDRSVRPDPLGLRYTFPSQAVGVKTTLDFLQVVGEDSEEHIRVLHEAGLDGFDISCDAAAWSRLVRFALNESGGGYDPRWHSGDWSSELSVDMLAVSGRELILDQHVQTTKQIFLDENEFISSDLFNATVKISKVAMTIPAVLDDDFRSSDLIVTIDELMVMVSSALPRTFLAGKLGASIYGDSMAKDKAIIFPNDPSDVCYHLDSSEDPSIRQRGEATKKSASTFRMQTTLRGLSVRVESPIVQCYVSEESRILLAPMETTMIACFEGEPPSSDDGTTKVAVIVSAQIHRLDVSLDPRVVASLLPTLEYHVSHSFLAKEIAESLLHATFDDVGNGTIPVVESVSIKKSLKGRRVLVRKQLQRSRQTGGLSISLCAQVSETRLRVWVQSAEAGANTASCPVECNTRGMESAIEASYRDGRSRIVAKLCLSHASLHVEALDESSSPIEVASLGTDDDRIAVATRAEEFVDDDSESVWAVAVEGYDAISSVFDIHAFEFTLQKLHEAVARAELLSFFRKYMILLKERWYGLRRSEGTLDIPSEGSVADLKDAILVYLPSRVHAIFMALRFSQVSATIPAGEGVRGISVSSSILTHLCYTSKLSSSENALLDVQCSTSGTWRDAFGNVDGRGLRHRMRSRCCVRDSLSDAPIVSPTEIGYHLTDSRLVVDGLAGVSIDDVMLLKEAGTSLFSHGKRAYDSLLRMTRADRVHQHLIRGPELSESRLCASQAHSLASARQQIEAIHEKTTHLEKELRACIQRNHEELKRLQTSMFQSAKERFGAVSLVSSHATGWLSVGCSQHTGQRGVSTFMLWPQWGVLKGSWLLLFPEPGDFTPDSIVYLGGASLRSLRGGQRKRDLKRAFGLLDESGSSFVIVANTDADFVRWTVAFQKCGCIVGDIESDDDRSYEVNDEGEVLRSLASRSAPIGRGIGRALTAARSTGKAVVDRRRKRLEAASLVDDVSLQGSHADLSTEIEGESQANGSHSDVPDSETGGSNNDEDDDHGNTSRRQQMRGRFTGVGQATRNRLAGVGQVTKRGLGSAGQVTKRGLGNALSAAKQKTADIAERRRNRLESASNQPDTVQPPPVSSSHADGDAWSCVACTYENPGGLLVCAMCSTAKEEGKDDEQLPSSGVDMTTIATESTLECGAEDEPSAALVQEVEEDSKAKEARFGFMRRRKEETSDDGRPAKSKLRNIADDGLLRLPPLPEADSPLDDSIPRKSLAGVWYATVLPLDSVEATSTSAHIPGPCSPSSLCIRVFRQNTDTGDMDLVTEVSRDFAEVLALHASLAESLSRIPSLLLEDDPPILGTSRSQSEYLPWTASLRSSPLATMKATGSLLAGVLQLAPDDPVRFATLART